MVGTTVSHYTILEKLGGGGMGVVYKARDLKLDRVVALKFLPLHLIPDQTERNRFIQEARAASALDHPNICTIYEIDETPEGQTFIAMAAYEGSTLSAKIADGPCKLDDAVDIAIQVAGGLLAAHAKGIVHRDIKSSNIILTTEGQVKILDFGLARTAGAAQLTKTGTSVGTVPYMSPEQARGHTVDHRTDIWSLGVVLYEIITARLPFPSEYSDAIVYAILNETPPPITSLRSGVPMELERIVNKTLQKESAARYQRLDEMLVDLRTVKHELESGSPPRQSAKPGKPRRWRTYQQGGIAAVIVLLIASVLYFTRFSGKDKADLPPAAANQQTAVDVTSRSSIAVLPFKNISSDKEQDYFCDGMTEQIITNLSNLQGLKVIARTSVMQFKNSDTPIPDIARKLGVANVLEGSIRKSGNRIRVTAQLIKADDGFHLWANDYDRELKDIFGVQDDVSKAIVAALKLNLSADQGSSIAKRHTENTEAYQLYLKGRFYWNKRTEEGLKKGIEYYQQAIEKDPVYALAYAGLAESYGVLGYYNWLAPKEAFPRAKAAAMKALEIDSALGEGHTALAIVERDYGWNWNAAHNEFKRAVALNPGYSTTHLWYANFFNILERHDDALAEMNKAVEIDPLSLVINADKGRTLYFARRYDESLEQLNKTLDLDPNFGLAYIWMGQVYEQKNMYENAISAYQKGLSLSDGSTYAMARLAHGFAMAGRKNEAQNLLDQLKTMSRQKYVSAFDIGVIYIGLGEKDQAFAWLERAYEERSHWLGFLNVDPSLDPLRADARFAILLEKMSLAAVTKL